MPGNFIKEFAAFTYQHEDTRGTKRGWKSGSNDHRLEKRD
jgi:hypothetical protein